MKSVSHQENDGHEEEQIHRGKIIGFLKQAEASMPIKERCRNGGVNDATFYKWRAGRYPKTSVGLNAVSFVWKHRALLHSLGPRSPLDFLQEQPLSFMAAVWQ